MSEIAVVGSINMDIVNRVERHPQPGETVQGLGCAYFPGGKGANQAVAAARMGASVSMVGAVGTDVHGEALLHTLRDTGIETAHTAVAEGSSGIAYITVDQAGENTIVLDRGANGKMLPDRAIPALERLEGLQLVLLQNEIPQETNEAVLKFCADRAIRVLYNPAPAAVIPDSLYPQLHMLILNASEAETLTGTAVSGEPEAMSACRQLLDKGAGQIVLTLGSQGVVYASRTEAFHIPALKVQAADTTAAGDCFIGALTAEYLQGRSIRDCLTFAAAAAALKVTRRGAQQSIPWRQEVIEFTSRRSI